MTVPRSPIPSTSLRRIASGKASAPGRGRRGRRGRHGHRGRRARARACRSRTGAARSHARASPRGGLGLGAAARARGGPRADLAALGDEPPKRADVLVVDVLDLVLAEQARLAAPAAGAALLVAPARGLAVALLCHLERPRLPRRHANARPMAARDYLLWQLGCRWVRSRGGHGGMPAPGCIEPPGVPEGSKSETSSMAGGDGP